MITYRNARKRMNEVAKSTLKMVPKYIKKAKEDLNFCFEQDELFPQQGQHAFIITGGVHYERVRLALDVPQFNTFVVELIDRDFAGSPVKITVRKDQLINPYNEDEEELIKNAGYCLNEVGQAIRV